MTVLTGRKFFIYVALFFGTVMAVNAVFISLALKSNSGVVEEHYYERGLRYDETLAQAEAQKELGWVVQLRAEDGRMIYDIRDAGGVPVAGKTVTVRMVRPVQDGYDFTVNLTDAGDGSYQGDFSLPLKGAWDAHISVLWDGGAFYDKVSLGLE